MSSLEEKEPDTKISQVISFGEEDIGTDRVITTIRSTITGKEVRITGDVDIAMKLAMGSERVPLSEEEGRRILRKIDLYLMPLMCFLYCCQFMDKISNSYASILGLRVDLNMEGNMYAWTGTAFYLGYLFFEFPASFLLQRYPVAKTVGAFIVVWGVILCLHSTPNYAGFVALRTILGMLESAVTPAFVIITGQWYKKEEQFLRTACWFSFNGLGNILGGAIAYGLAMNEHSYSMRAWKLVFIVTGVITIFLGSLVLLHIPDSPAGAWFLSEDEKLKVLERIRSNQQGFGNRHFKKHQFIEAICDVQTWLIFLFGIVNCIPNGGITNFSAILLHEDFGYSPTESLLMGMPGGGVQLVGCIGLAYCAKYVKHRLFWAIISCVIVIMAACLLAFSDNNQVKYAGYVLFTISPVGMICVLSIVASNIAGHTKKVTANAIYLIGYCTGNLIGPQTFIATQAPTYMGAKIAIVVCYSLSLVVLGGIYYIYWSRNKKRDAMGIAPEFSNFQNAEFADLTDKENPHFRYSL